MTPKWIIPQSDYTLLLQVDALWFEEMRNFLSIFTHAEKTPEHIHTYKIGAVSIWNAASLWYKPGEIIQTLKDYSLFEVPNNVEFFIKNQFRKYWLIKILEENGEYIIEFGDKMIQKEIENMEEFEQYIAWKIVWNWKQYFLKPLVRWKIKAFLIKYDFPVEDIAWYKPWEKLEIWLKWEWNLRDYQQKAIDSFWMWWWEKWWSWVIVLACWWGKTIVWIWVLEKAQTKTLIITTTANACFGFRKEILSKTTLSEEQVWVFAWTEKEIKDVTITTYSMLTHRVNTESEFTHMSLFYEVNWGLIIYDEVHMLPAPVFSYVSELQSKRRLWLTATLVREDHKEDLIFSLIWPKKYDLPWKQLETSGFIAKATCIEIRVKMSNKLRNEYIKAQKREKFKIASTNSEKIKVIKNLIKKNSWEKILIIWEYLDQLKKIQQVTGIDMITWKMESHKREELFDKFRDWKIDKLILSRVANFAIDLPDASVLIEVSWLYGSRQEEAQRLGRILRPKKWKNEARFYIVVTNDSREVEFVEKRQIFLIEQWYNYDIEIF